MGIRVKNILTKFKARLHRRELHRHLNGMFLRVGDRKIPPGREDVVDPRFMDQVQFLVHLGVLQIVGNANMATHEAPVNVVVSPKKHNIRINPPGGRRPVGGAPVIYESDDFVIITASGPVFEEEPVEPPVEEIPEVPEVPELPEEEIDLTEEEKVEEPVVKIEEVREEKVEKTPTELMEEKIMAEMKRMISEGRDLTKTGKPEVWVLKDRLNIELTAKERDRLFEKLGEV